MVGCWLTVISRTHFEHCPHKWLISWTLTRSEGPNAGGNFYLPQYGVKVESAANSLVAWQPRMWHGTSLRDCDPENIMASIREVGVSFVTSPRLATRWKQYAASNYSREALEAMEHELGEDGYDTDVEGDEMGDADLDEGEERWWMQM